MFPGCYETEEERNRLEREYVEQAAADSTLAKTEERLDHAEMVTDMREVTDADVDAAVAEGGEPADPEACFADAMDEAQRVCLDLPATHAAPLERALRLVYQSVLAIIQQHRVQESTDVDKLLDRAHGVTIDKTLAALPSGETK